MKSSATMAIGEAAGHFGLASHVLRHWEDMGLLAPVRDAGGRRRYDRSDFDRIAAILLARDAGLALTDIRDMLMTPDRRKRRDITRRHCDDLTRKIAEMQAALNFLEGGLSCDYDDITKCPSYQSMVAARLERASRENEQRRSTAHQAEPARMRDY